METIKEHQADESAATRLAVWAWTWDYVQKHPFGGGFEMYRQNQIRYETIKRPISTRRRRRTDAARPPHRSASGTEVRPRC